MTWLITPEQTLSAARQAGLSDEDLKLGSVAVLTFSKAVVDRLEALCGLEDAAWIAPQHHPYAAAEIVKHGAFEGLGIMVLVRPWEPLHWPALWRIWPPAECRPSS